MTKFKYTINGTEYNVSIEQPDENNIAEVTVNGERYSVQLEDTPQAEEKPIKATTPIAEEDVLTATPTTASSDGKAIKAPLPGTITSIAVQVGQQVKAGDTLVVLEAMKMANNIEAETDGIVTAICVKQGQAVLEEDPLVVIG